MSQEISERQQRIREDLSSEIDGEVRVEPLDRLLYATDASLYQILPEAIAYPASHDDVATLVRYADENDLQVHCRGRGSGVAGGCLGPGLVIDFSRSMRRLLSLDVEAQTCRVEAGVVRDELNRRLEAHGLYFAPDPATAPITTIGGMAAVDAAGSHRVRHGSCRDHINAMRTVLSDGSALDATRTTSIGEELDDDSNYSLATGTTAGRLSRVHRLLRRNAELIEASFVFRPAAAAGYSLLNVCNDTADAADRSLDLVQLLVGSEGTLAATTELDLRLTPLAAARRAMLVCFQSVEAAIEASLALRDDPPDACDLLDRRLLGIARKVSPRFDPIIPATAECGLVIDVMGAAAEEVDDRLASLRDRIRKVDATSRVLFVAEDTEEAKLLWSLPSRVLPLLTRLSGDVRPLPFVEDIVLPPERMGEALRKIRKVFQRYDATASVQSHVLTGQVHLRPMLAMPTSTDDRHRIESIARDLYQIVFSHNGTISGEHGDGLSRTAFLRSRFGPLYPVFKQVKDLFDPLGRMNRDKIISDDPHLTVKHLRSNPSTEELPGLQLIWPTTHSLSGDAKTGKTIRKTAGVNGAAGGTVAATRGAGAVAGAVAGGIAEVDMPGGFDDEANRCTGCGDCLRSDRATRMCPVMTLDRLEDNSPRSKANAARGILDGSVAAETLHSPEMKRLAERCFNCKQCQVDCPTHVDVPHLMIEAKAAAFGERGLSRADWFLSRAHSFGRFAGPLAPLLNASLNSPGARWLLEKTIGLAQRRKLPRFANRSFLRSIRDERFPTTQGTERGEVLYFVDHYANFHDPDLAAATIAVLQHNGYSVRVPRGQQPSGMAMISTGDLEAARDVAAQNLDLFGPLAAEGLPVVSAEPAAVLALRDDYPRLVKHPETGSLSKATVDLGHFLKSLLVAGELRTDFRPVDADVSYHTPCHVTALGPDRPLLEILQLVPRLTVTPFELGCSGMAGTYGLSAAHYTDSIRIGRRLIRHTRRMSQAAGTTECSGCKMQMEQGTDKPTVHPVKLLALAYGLMPQLAATLQRSKKPLLVS